jgi:hypothetical protein
VAGQAGQAFHSHNIKHALHTTWLSSYIAQNVKSGLFYSGSYIPPYTTVAKGSVWKNSTIELIVYLYTTTICTCNIGWYTRYMWYRDIIGSFFSVS